MYSVMAQHHGGAPQVVFAERAEDEALRLLRQQAEILKGYYKQWKMIGEVAFCVFSSDTRGKEFCLTRLWVEQEDV